MSTANEHFEVLVAKVAELIDILMEIGSADSGGNGESGVVAEGLARYIRQVETIATAAESAEYFGLHNICMFYRELVDALTSQGDALNESAQMLLEEWPMLVAAYLEAPAELDAVAALVGNLQNPVWETPLSDEDVALLQDLLIQESTPSFVLEPIAPEPVALELSEVAVEDHIDEITASDAASAPAVSVADTTPGEVETPLALEPVDVAVPELDALAKELIHLLDLEVNQLARQLGDALTAADGEEWRQVLANHAEDLERLRDGFESMRLKGLQQVSECLHENVLVLASQEETLNEAQHQIVVGWAVPVSGYLQALHDIASQALVVQYLRDTAWPQPLAQVDAAILAETLGVLNLDLGADDEEPRQMEAQPEDMSLLLPEDVNPELLDCLLQEMPRQAEDFSAAIQRLSSSDGSLADIDAAHRIAHTLKGAANTVGVIGVANLTHHLEDILLALTQYSFLPTAALQLSLVTAADCLEAMSEALLGMSDPVPEHERLGVLQEVLDWANWIDREGMPRDGVGPAVRETLPGLTDEVELVDAAEPEVAEAAQPKVVNTMAGTRIAADLVDELLRLAGEAMILNGQLHDRLERTIQQLDAVHGQNATLQQLALELEQLVDICGVTQPLLHRVIEDEFDPLEMEQYNELHTVSRRLMEAVTDAREMHQGVDSGLTDLNGLLTDQRRVQRENEETVMRTRMVPVNTISSRLQRGVRQACRLTEKEADLVINGGETLMDSNVLSSLVDPLMHLLRNAVDHGLESPRDRELAGKPRVGRIALEFVREGNTIVVRCGDDGAGLNLAAIRCKALERGLIRDNQTLSEEETSRLILQPGFSTCDETTQISGRGIGMDAVYSRVQELKGSLAIQSQPDQGCLVELRLPVTLMSTHGLLIRLGRDIMAVSDHGVEQVLYPGMGQVGQIGSKGTYQLGEEVFETTILSGLLNLAPDRCDAQRAEMPGLLIREESGRRRVVFVQEVTDSLALVVKSLGRYIPDIQGLIGATILGDGRVAPVLDLPDLLRSPARIYAVPVRSQESAVVASSAPVALPVAVVVDDSLSARRALADFVRDLGFNVRMASDGLEAVSIIDNMVPAILLTDLEMPRMNGLELTAHVRSREATQHVPVIMITSRSTEKHQQSAAQAGVDAYLVKPFSEDDLALHIQQLTVQPGVA